MLPYSVTIKTQIQEKFYLSKTKCWKSENVTLMRLLKKKEVFQIVLKISEELKLGVWYLNRASHICLVYTLGSLIEIKIFYFENYSALPDPP